MSAAEESDREQLQIQDAGEPWERLKGQQESKNCRQSEAYSGKDIMDKLRTTWVGRTVKFYDSLDSTNLMAKAEAEKGAPSGTLIVADMQTAGRGRRGRTWESPKGTNIYNTLILRPDFEPEKASMLTLLMALAVAEGVEKTCLSLEQDKVKEPRPGIKWPNDVVVNGRKICGILTEMNFVKDGGWYVVIGTGINVGQQTFAPELAERAASLAAEYGKRVSRSVLLAHVMEAFEEVYKVFCEHGNLSGVKVRYESLLVNKDREVRVLDPKGEYRGVARGIQDTGELLVEFTDRQPDGQPVRQMRTVCAGEVSVRGIYGYSV